MLTLRPAALRPGRALRSAPVPAALGIWPRGRNSTEFTRRGNGHSTRASSPRSDTCAVRAWCAARGKALIGTPCRPGSTQPRYRGVVLGLILILLAAIPFSRHRTLRGRHLIRPARRSPQPPAAPGRPEP